MSSKQETEQNMCDRLTVNYAKKPCYEIVYRDSFKDLSKEVEPFVKDAEKIRVITDTVVAPLYAEEVKKALAYKMHRPCFYNHPGQRRSCRQWKNPPVQGVLWGSG